jgi:LCP family protein required for cell wall assembly
MSHKAIMIISLLIVITGIGLFSIYSSVESTVERMQEPLPLKIPVSTYREIPDPIKHKQPISFLLLGVDEREDDKGRADTMIVVTVNPNNNTTKMISIPRDSYTKIIGTEKEDKINHAYAFGGVEMSKATVENLLQIPIDYTISINMEGFIGLVDAVEGVEVENNLAFDVDQFTYELGPIHLQGEQALAFVRMRYDDPNGDFGRQERQKIVLDAIIDKLKSFNSVWKYKELLGLVGDHVRTNLTFDEMKTISKDYYEAINEVESLSFQKGQGQTLQQIWYYMLDAQELEAIQNQLKTHLELIE